MDPIILVLRILVPLSIFRFPLLGGLSSLFLDGLDWWVNIFGIEDIRNNYQVLDKLLDIYYLSIEAYVVWRWKNKVARRVGLGMYFYRLVGVFLFELTGVRLFLFVFLNIFESFFLFYLLCRKILGREPKISLKLLVFSVIVLFIPKVLQEYPQHAALFWHWRNVEIGLFSRRIVFPYDNVIHQGLIVLGIVVFICVLLRSQAKKWKGLKKIGER